MNFSRRMVDGLPDGSLVDLEVTSFHGKRLQLSVTRGLNGWQLQQLILQKLSRPGRRLLLQHGAVPLKLQETLEQQGITGRRSNKNQLYYIYICSVTSYLLLSLLISLLYCRASHTGDTDTIRVMYSIVV